MHRNKFVLMDEAPADGGTGGGGTGGGGPDFASLIPAEFKGHTALAPIKDMTGLVKSYIHAQSQMGADKLVLPKADAPDAAWGDVWKKLGRPETHDKYDFKLENAPEGFPFSDEDLKFAKQAFHEAGLPAKMATNLFNKWMGHQVQQFQAEQQKQGEAKQQFVQQLRSKYGAETDTKIAMAAQTVQRIGGQKLAQFMDETGLGDHPMMVEMFINLGSLIANDESIRDKFVNSGFVSNKDEALQKIASLQGDQEFMAKYTNAEAAGHAEAVEQMRRLFATAYPGQQNPNA